MDHTKGTHRCLKPIFHWKLGLRLVPNANEINTKNMKCTWPTQDFCVGDPTQPIFHWLALGLCVRANANFKFCVRGKGFALAPRYQHVLASGVLPNANP